MVYAVTYLFLVIFVKEIIPRNVVTNIGAVPIGITDFYLQSIGIRIGERVVDRVGIPIPCLR